MIVQIIEVQDLMLRSIRDSIVKASSIEAIYLSSDGKSAINTYKRYHPNLLIIDVELPKMSGLQLAETIIGFKSNSRILMISGHINEAIVCGISRLHGISGFLFKSGNFFHELNCAIARIVRNEHHFCTKYRNLVYQYLRSGKKLDAILGFKERRILGLVGAGWSDEEIAAQIQTAESTVRWQTRQLRHKLGVNSHRELMKIAHKVGLAGSKWEEMDLVDNFDIP